MLQGGRACLTWPCQAGPCIPPQRQTAAPCAHFLCMVELLICLEAFANHVPAGRQGPCRSFWCIQDGSGTAGRVSFAAAAHGTRNTLADAGLILVSRLARSMISLSSGRTPVPVRSQIDECHLMQAEVIISWTTQSYTVHAAVSGAVCWGSHPGSGT